MEKRIGLVQSKFPRELAAFISFIGPKELENSVERVAQKMKPLNRQSRKLYRDRFYFHKQFVEFTLGASPFKLATAEVDAVRAASLIAGVNRIRNSITTGAASHFRAMVLDNLKPDRDIRQIEHEIRCWTHFTRKGFKVTFADLEGSGNFDLLVDTPAGTFEAECKTVSEETGSPLKTDFTVRLYEDFSRTARRVSNFNGSGLFVLTLKVPLAQIPDLIPQVRAFVLSGESAGTHKAFDLEFLPKPEWDKVSKAEPFSEVWLPLLAECGLESDAKGLVEVGGRLIGLLVRPHRPGTLPERIVGVIKDAADQCTGTRPCLVWLHFVDMDDTFLLQLASHSSDGQGGGLNALVTRAIHPEASSTPRNHVARVRFSATGSSLSSAAAIGPDLLIGKAITLGGPAYDVPNPFSAFPFEIDP